MKLSAVVLLTLVLPLLPAPHVSAQTCAYTYDDMLKPSSASEGFQKWPNSTCVQIKFNGTTGFGVYGEDAVECGFKAWNTASYAYTFYVTGSCNAGPDFQKYGYVYFVTDSLAWSWGDSTTGDTEAYTSNGYITSFLTHVNMDPTLFGQQSWTLTCESNKFDLASVALHEAGHALGLKHPGVVTGDDTGCTSTVMRSVTPRGRCYSCTLLSWDKLAINDLYNFVPAATVAGFAVVAGTAQWRVSSEYRTARYRVDGSNSLAGPWTSVAVDSAGAGGHAVDVSGGGFAYYRLVEEETDGRLRGLSVAEATDQVIDAPSFVAPDPASLRAQLDSLMAVAAARATTRASATSNPCVIYTDSAFVDDVDAYVADFWRLYGYDVRVIPIDGRPADPDSFRTALKASIAAWADTTGARYFQLIGDANDWREFDGDLTSSYWVGSWETIRQGYFTAGYPSGGQPDKDIIPTFAVADTASRGSPGNMTYLVPYYFTDQPYADTDNDGVPDVVVTRWPVSESWQLLSLALKMEDYNLAGSPSPSASYRVGMFGYDRNINVFNGSLWASHVHLFVDSLGQALSGLPSTGSVSFVYGSDLSGPPVSGTEIATTWNAVAPDLAVMDATNSDRYFPCMFLDKSAASDPFYVGLLSQGRRSIVFAASCASSDWARTEDPHYGAPLCEDMLYDYSDRGAVAWVGPSEGSWLGGDEALLWDMADSLLTRPTRPMAESFLTALQAVYGRYAGSPRILRAAHSYNYLGDPLSPLVQPDIVTPVSEDAPASNWLGANFPNPFNPSTTVPYSVREQSRVRLTVYDVLGRRVRVLVDKTVDAGPHVARWDGTNAHGRRVSSGIYFVVLEAAQIRLARKLVLVQ